MKTKSSFNLFAITVKLVLGGIVLLALLMAVCVSRAQTSLDRLTPAPPVAATPTPPAQFFPPQFLTNAGAVYQFYGKYDQTFIPASGNTANDIQALIRDALTVTNFAAYIGGGYSLSGPKTYLADFGLIYNVNQYVGLVAGFDWLRLDANGQAPQETANVVKGGCQLSYTFALPVMTNILWTPYGMSLVATPTKGTDNNGGVGLINAFGMGETLWHNQTWSIKLVEGFENRTGEGAFDRNYVTANLAAACGF